MSFIPVGDVGTDGCEESGDGKADAARGDGLERHVVAVVVFAFVQDILEYSNVKQRRRGR